MQTASQILMIRPVNFFFNTETAVNNTFQNDIAENIQAKALQEFNGMVNLLRENGIEVTVVEDTIDPATPDSIFPNNWISFHEDNSIAIYPMFAPNRRQERKQHVLDALSNKFSITQIHNLSHYENEDRFLEGTGSMVLDRKHRVAYACISPRTDPGIFLEFCSLYNFTPITFNARDSSGTDIYHTNVMMCMADNYAVICMGSIQNKKELEKISDALKATQKELIDISLDQLNHFAGNMLQVKNRDGELLLVMSTQAFESLTPVQIRELEKYNRIIHSSLDTIETCGGGSARCMIAEIFNSVK